MINYVQVGAEVADGFLKDIATQQVFLPHSACSYCEYNVREVSNYLAPLSVVHVMKAQCNFA